MAESTSHPAPDSSRSPRDSTSAAQTGSGTPVTDHPVQVPGPDQEAAGVAPPPVGTRASDGGERIPRQRRERRSDRALNLLLLAAERGVRIGMTVSVGGVIVTGTLVGALAYCRALADQFASVTGGTDMDETLADSFRDLVDDVSRVSSGDRRNPPDPVSYEHSMSFIHLANARYVSGSAGLLPHGRKGVLWRCPVSDVSGWSLGDLTSSG